MTAQWKKIGHNSGLFDTQLIAFHFVSLLTHIPPPAFILFCCVCIDLSLSLSSSLLSLSYCIMCRFVAISLLRQHFHMPVQRRTTNPMYAPAMVTFDFLLYLILVEHLGQGSVEAVVWDKDILGKEYLGKVVVRVEEWFGGEGEGEREREFGFDAERNIVCLLPSFLPLYCFCRMVGVDIFPFLAFCLYSYLRSRWA